MHDDWPRGGGIYRIWLTRTHYYIGRTSNCKVRWLRHLANLRRGTHPNAHMQNVYNIYGVFRPELVVAVKHSDESRKRRSDEMKVVWALRKGGKLS